MVASSRAWSISNVVVVFSSGVNGTHPRFQPGPRPCYTATVTPIAGRSINSDGTRLIFWLDLLVLMVGIGAVMLGKWDFVLAMAIALLLMNGYNTLWNQWRKR